MTRVRLLAFLFSAAFTPACGASSSIKSSASDGTTEVAAQEDSIDTGSGSASTDEGGDALSWCQELVAEGWSEDSHAKGVDGNYAQVFEQPELPRLDITICPDDYGTMREDLESLLGSSGGGGGRPEDGVETDENPVYVPVMVAFDGQTWPYVGMRYKGNSSLSIAWREGIDKLPFRLEFDRFEDDVPEVEDQRFHGFKELKFSSAMEDDSLIRDKLTSDLFREAGVPAAAGGMMAVYVDVGDGPVFWGVYGAFEDPSGELLDSWFGDDSGNAYKPDGDAAALGYFDADHFEKKTNEDAEDWSDIEAMITALNADGIDAAAWRTGLEATFDVDGFLRYLALNNLIGNWDSYGNMTHNYYLYADPALDGRLSWIPWDFNEALRTDGKKPLVPVSLEGVGSEWPLIAAIASDPVYLARYREHLEDLLGTVFTEANVRGRAELLHARVADAAAAEASPYTHLSSVSAFEQSLDSADGVVTRVSTATEEAEAFLEP